MATGHTHPVIDGEITTLKDFAYECSRSFVWSFREGNVLAYPSRHDSYYAEALPKALAELTAWDALDEAGRYAAWSEYAEEKSARAGEAKAQAAENAARIQPLLDEVYNVTVPDTHARFKEFMIEQLEETLRLDGTYNASWYAVEPYGKWVDGHRESILWTMRRCAEGLAEAEENNRKSREWISTLASLFDLEVVDADEDIVNGGKSWR